MTGESKTTSARAARRRPTVLVYLIVFVCVLAALFLQFYDRVVGYDSDSSIGDINASLDAAYSNILTYVVSFVAIVTPMAWLAVFSDVPRSLRFLPILMLAGLIVLTPVLCDVRVNGDMVPSFRWRWLPEPDEQLQVAVENAALSNDMSVVLSVESPDDFSQFLGPNRNATIDNVRLARNWNEEPPTQLWRQPIGAGWSGFAVVNGFAVTLEQRGEDELVTCYELKTGKPRWSRATKTRHDTVMGGIGPRSTPAIHKGNVYTLGATGTLLCLKGTNGEVIWSKNLMEEFGVASHEKDLKNVAWGRASSPLIVDNLVVVPAGGPTGKCVSLVAYKRDSGNKVWTAGTTQISYSSPMVANLFGKRQIISVNENNATGHEVATGEILWQVEWPGQSNMGANVAQPVPLQSNRMLLSKGYGKGSALWEFDAQGNPTQLWHKRSVMKTKFTNPVVIDGYVYGLSDGILECVEIETGRRQWKGGRYGHGQILLVGDVILVLSEGGELIMVEPTPDDHQELARFQALGGKTWNTLCLSGKHLLVRNGEQAACYELDLRDAP